MRKYTLILCLLLFTGVFSACKSDEPALSTSMEISNPISEIQSEMETSNVLKQEQKTESQYEFKPGHESAAESKPELPDEDELVSKEQPITSAPVALPNASLVIHIVDMAGNPVKNVSGTLELGAATAESSPPGISLVGNDFSKDFTGEDGNLYFIEKTDMLPEKGTLILTAYYDNTIRQSIPIELSASKGETTVTWTGSTPPSKVPDAVSRRITFLIVDEKGNPVSNVYGGLEESRNGMTGYRPLTGNGHDSVASDESGILYLELATGWEDKEPQRECRLILNGYYDNSLQQSHKLKLADPPTSYTITWKLPLPPKERPLQSTGIRILFVDVKNNPVQGIELGGSPYPKETTGDIPDLSMILGPSDKDGYIRWDDVKPGTYELYGSKDGKSQKYEVKMPKDKNQVNITLTWNQ